MPRALCYPFAGLGVDILCPMNEANARVFLRGRDRAEVRGCLLGSCHVQFSPVQLITRQLEGYFGVHGKAKVIHDDEKFIMIYSELKCMYIR